MPKFLYTAKNSATGETSGGEREAKDEKSLAQELRAQGLLLTSHKELKVEQGVRVKFLDRFKRVPLKEKMTFTRNLAVMIASGLTVSRSIHNLSLQTKNRLFQKILGEVKASLESGKTLSDSMAEYPKVFNELFVNMIAVGEISGNLEQVLEILALQLEKENDLLSKVRGALIYPAVIVGAMIAIAILMLVYILPKITGVFEDMEVELPATTQFIIAISDFLRGHYLLSIAIVVVAAGLIKWLIGTPAGKRFFDTVLLYSPIVGNIIVKVNCARFARIYSSLLKSGISVINALNIVGKTLSNVRYKTALTEATAEIQKGVELSKVLEKYPAIFPVLVTQILQVGEETGKTETVLQKLAEFYEEEVSQITKNMSSIIEPILMLLIGSAVGFFAIAMLQPMYSVLENIK